MAGANQRVHDQPRRAFDRDRQVCGTSKLAQALEHRGQALGIVADLVLIDNLPGLVDDGDGVALATPVQTTEQPCHMRPPSVWSRSLRAGGSCGMLTDGA